MSNNATEAVAKEGGSEIRNIHASATLQGPAVVGAFQARYTQSGVSYTRAIVGMVRGKGGSNSYRRQISVNRGKALLNAPALSP